MNELKKSFRVWNQSEMYLEHFSWTWISKFCEIWAKIASKFSKFGYHDPKLFFSSFLFSYKRVLKGFGCGRPNLEISATHLLSIIWKITLKILKNWVVCSMNMGNLWVLMRVNGSPCINRSSWCRMILLLPADPTESIHTDKSPSGYLAAFLIILLPGAFRERDWHFGYSDHFQRYLDDQ